MREIPNDASRMASPSRFDRVAMTGSILGFSLPTFWVGLMLIVLFAVNPRR